MTYLILFLYLSFTFWGSLWGLKNKNKTPESYFLADRGLTTLSLFFTILATNFSAFYFLGFAGEGYKIGYIHYIMMAVGTSLAGVAILILGPKIWKLGKQHSYMTPSELVFGQTGSRALAVLFSAVMIIFTFPYLALQIVGGGYILENLTQGELPYTWAIILLTVFTIAYVLVGGMTSVARTDLKQGILMILFMTLAVIFISDAFGGISSANEQARGVQEELFQLSGVKDHYTPQKWFSFLIFWFFCIPMFPQLFMRFYIAKDLSHLKKSAILYAFIPIFISILPVMIGVWGHISFPDLSSAEADKILPKMLAEHTSEAFAALIMTGAIAAFMSTLDSQLLAISTMFTRDFYMPLRKKTLSFDSEVKIGRIFVAIFATIGLLIAFQPFATIFDMGKMAFSGLAVLFPTCLAVLFFKIKNVLFLILSILISLVTLFGFYYAWIPEQWNFGFENFVIIILISHLLCLPAIGKRRSI